MSVKIVSDTTSTNLIIDTTSQAARVTPYDSLGNNRGVKATYRASTTASIAALTTSNSGTPFFTLCGSASKTIIVQRIMVTGPTLTAVAYNAINVWKYSTAPTGGTPANLTQVPLDANSAAGTATNVSTWAGAIPTGGFALIGSIASRRTLYQATTAAAGGNFDVPMEFDFRTVGSENSGIYLRGVAQGIGLSFAAAPASAVTVGIEIEWTEE